jgi:hypothetical protein
LPVEVAQKVQRMLRMRTLWNAGRQIDEDIVGGRHAKDQKNTQKLNGPFALGEYNYVED